MAKVGVQRAADLTGKSKSTIQRAMNSGKLSFELDGHKRRVVDVSELERVFGIKQKNPPQENTVNTTNDIAEAVEKERMRMQIKMLEKQLAVADERVEDLISQRDEWQKQASQILITSQYSQRQAEELRAQIKEREERARQKRLQQAQAQKAKRACRDGMAQSASAERENLDSRMKKLKAQNENIFSSTPSVFRFWKRSRS